MDVVMLELRLLMVFELWPAVGHAWFCQIVQDLSFYEMVMLGRINLS
jgi:hypothetical protein